MVESCSLAVAALVVHAILFVSIFDIYFTSPVESVTRLHSYTLKPPAKRLVLIVADGLRADSIFSLDENENSPAPYLREIVTTKGRWGVSHTHVPTESRPGHVALIAGLYEDVSAVTRGWQENPVQFDSVFNRSRHTWSWGSPDILPMFAKGAVEGRVETFTYDSSWEDFADSDASKLDWWVFDKVTAFFKHAKENQTLAQELDKDKLVFFLHLLGIDTNGHAHRPTSKEVVENLRYVDSEMKEVTNLINSYFRDNATSFVFTSDHGMTNWGSHGAGLPEETMTPLICWGAGIKMPRSNRYAEKVYHDGYSEKWGLERLERVDVEQADIAPLMTTLIGGAIPANSEGILPTGYIHYNKGFVAASTDANARQLYEQVSVKEARARENSLPWTFRPFPKMSKSEMEEQQAKIVSLLQVKQYEMARDLSMAQIGVYKEAVTYYHTYHRTSLLVVLFLGFSGWMACVIVCIAEDEIRLPRAFHGSRMINSGVLVFPVKSFLFMCVVSLLLLYQASPLLYYLYYGLAIFSWRYVWKRRFLLQSVCQIGSSGLLKGVACALVTLCGLELLVFSFFRREVLSLVLLLLSAWPHIVTLERKELKYAWSGACVLLACFPLFPVVDRNSSYGLVSLAGILASTVAFSLLCVPRAIHALRLPAGSHAAKRIFLQVFLLFLSSFVPALTHWFFKQKEGIPVAINVFCWSILALSLLLPFLGPKSVTGRLFHIFISLYSTFVLLSTSYEALFVLLLSAALFLWLVVENGLSSSKHKVASVWNSFISFSSRYKFDSLLAEAPTKPGLSVEHVRQVFFSVFLGVLSFFGTGNIASVNTFDPATVYCFLTVFSPFVMGALILWKMVIPFILVSCVFNVVTSLSSHSLKTQLLLMLLMTDVMGFNFFFLVRDSGSWLEIGISISHYVIMMSMIIGVTILVGVARLLTGSTVESFKEEY